MSRWFRGIASLCCCSMASRWSFQLRPRPNWGSKMVTVLWSNPLGNDEISKMIVIMLLAANHLTWEVREATERQQTTWEVFFNRFLNGWALFLEGQIEHLLRVYEKNEWRWFQWIGIFYTCWVPGNDIYIYLYIPCKTQHFDILVRRHKSKWVTNRNLHSLLRPLAGAHDS